MKLAEIMDFDRFKGQVPLVIVKSVTKHHSELNAIKRHFNGYSRTFQWRKFPLYKFINFSI